MQLIDIYYQMTPFNEESVIKAFNGALNSDMPIEAKVLFAQRKVEFLEDLGSIVTRYGICALPLSSATFEIPLPFAFFLIIINY